MTTCSTSTGSPLDERTFLQVMKCGLVIYMYYLVPSPIPSISVLYNYNNVLCTAEGNGSSAMQQLITVDILLCSLVSPTNNLQSLLPLSILIVFCLFVFFYLEYVLIHLSPSFVLSTNLLFVEKKTSQIPPLSPAPTPTSET